MCFALNALLQLNLGNRVREVISVLRLAPFETSTPEGLARERHRRILLTTVASVGAKAVGVITSLLIVPLTLRYLGAERYGMWMMISTLFGVLTASDLGIGNGLLNVVASAHGKEDKLLIRKNVSSAFFMLSTLGSLVLLAFLCAWPFLQPSHWFNVVSELATHEASQGVMVLVVMFAINLPLTVVLRLQEGLQEGFNLYLIQMIGSVLSLALVALSVMLNLGVPWLVLSLLAGQALANFGSFLLQFFSRKTWARPRIGHIEWQVIKALAKTGGLFFVLNLLTLLTVQSDTFIIAQVLGPATGPAEVANYSVVQRLSQLAFFYWAFTQALWPAYGEALARQDHAWVRTTIKKSLIISLLCGGGIGLVLYLFGSEIIRLWLGQSVHPSPVLLLSFAFYVLVNSIVGTFAVLLNAGDLLKKQLQFLLATALVACVLKILLCAKFGSSGPVWATVAAFAFCFILPAAVEVRRRFWRA